MKENCNVAVWGVRGSFPTPDAHFLTYGGNTSCISVEFKRRIIVFDAGSGLIPLGDHLYERGIKKVDILLSHLHLDHVMGLFRFKLLYDKDAEIHLYGESNAKGMLAEHLKTLTSSPYWPIGLFDCPAHIEIHEIHPGEHFPIAGHQKEKGLSETSGETENVRIYTMRSNHPDSCLLYRLESGAASIVYALDCEMNEDIFSSLNEFSKGSELIIWDANFTEEDLKKHRGWGHSSFEQGMKFCQTAGIKKILMTHYSPEYPDEFLRNLENKAKQTDVPCCFAKEGMVLRI